jgi:hypothetical protein
MNPEAPVMKTRLGTGAGLRIRDPPVVLTCNQMVVGGEESRDDEKATDLLFGALADPTRRDIFRRAVGALGQIDARLAGKGV